MQAGKPAVFCRFAGCNLWTGLEADRTRAVCQFCDTDFVGTDGQGGGKFATADLLAAEILKHWQGGEENRLCVLTGGEPLLQLDGELAAALHTLNFTIAVETNGTQERPEGIDWLCMSPKSGTELAIKAGDELKLVYPQKGAEPEKFTSLDFKNFLLQPMDGPDVMANTRAAIEYCMKNPRWRLSAQTHKMLGLR